MSLLPLASAQTAFVTLGEDPMEDGAHHIAPGANVGALVSDSRTDIVAVHMAEVEGQLLVNMTIAAPPSGTGGYMYRVSFVHEEARYFTCWNIQWTGNEVEEENVLGCSRFNQDDDGAQVGPTTTSEGVVVGAAAFNGTDAAYVQWPVELATLGASLGIVANVTADTWFRGVSACCPGSTTSSRYLWNPSDRAPDEGDWLFDPNAVTDGEPLGVTVRAEVANVTIRPGQYVTYGLDVGLNGTAPDENVTLALSTEGLEEWNWRFEPEVVALNATNRQASALLNIAVARDRPAGTTAFHVTACSDAGLCGDTTLAFTIEGLAVEPPVEANVTTNATTTADGNATAGQEAGLPGPAPLLLVGVALVLLARRRHRP